MSYVVALSTVLGDIFSFGVGIILFKILVFIKLVFALESVHGLALFKSEVDWRTGGPKVNGFVLESYECLLRGSRLILYKVLKGQEFVFRESRELQSICGCALKTFGKLSLPSF
jgi:hypothetical protein